MWDDEDYEPEPLDAGKVVDDKWDGEDEEVRSKPEQLYAKAKLACDEAQCHAIAMCSD